MATHCVTDLARAALVFFAMSCAPGAADDGALVSIPAAPSADPDVARPSAEDLVRQSAPSASATPGPEESPEALERAKQAFKRGIEAFQSGRHADARQAFEEAYAAVPNHRVLYNLGQVLLIEGRIAQGCETLQRYLDEADQATRARQLPQLLSACPGLR